MQCFFVFFFYFIHEVLDRWDKASVASHKNSAESWFYFWVCFCSYWQIVDFPGLSFCGQSPFLYERERDWCNQYIFLSSVQWVSILHNQKKADGFEFALKLRPIPFCMCQHCTTRRKQIGLNCFQACTNPWKVKTNTFGIGTAIALVTRLTRSILYMKLLIWRPPNAVHSLPVARVHSLIRRSSYTVHSSDDQS